MAQNCIGGALSPSKTLTPKCIPINHPNPSSLSSSSLRKLILTKSKKCLPLSVCISASMSSSQQHQPPLSLEALKTSEHRNKFLNAIQSSLSNCLSETHLDLTVPGLKSKTRGKVRDIYDGGNYLVLVTTDRQSAFDRVLASIPFKGQVLNETSLWWLNKSQHIVPNAVVSAPDKNVTIAKKCLVFPIEFVVRGYVTGSTDTSLWTVYKKVVRNYCGNVLPDDYEETSKRALQLFAYGQRVAIKHGLVLVDTKYEFGKAPDGTVFLVDEVHIPDSSRYWIGHSYQEHFWNGLEPENVDKEFLRLWFNDHCNPYEDKVILFKLVLCVSFEWLFPLSYSSELIMVISLLGSCLMLQEDWFLN
ncbi:phosphoribosylaminoimidazole-succinocarboxamide synthase, chloroplastic-like isoform X3 [Coffea arabica]|uniref:phosphoribosylaminoimidazolesuccinocarboxamide synthase n=1 Tax=Coffea arabica TaxID=13443 RepID=A0ABM4VW95_COFAR